MARSLGNANNAAAAARTQWPVELVEVIIEPGNASATLRYSNLFHEITVDGDVYSPAVAFLGISAIRDDLEARDDDISITLSGVTSGIISLILNYKMPGSTIKIYRGFYDEDTGALVEDPYQVWDGIVSSWSVQDDNQFSSDDAVIVSLSCRSTIESLLGRRNGLFTSVPSIQRHYNDVTGDYNDRSFDFVAGLIDKDIEFGKPLD